MTTAQHRPTQSMAAALGDTRGNYAMRDMADGMGNWFGRIAQQRLFAAMHTAGVNDRARARGMEYVR